ncbi:MAG: MotA/TolQ/ExbB proton channel family protein [Chthoniobacterales bacterium]
MKKLLLASLASVTFALIAFGQTPPPPPPAAGSSPAITLPTTAAPPATTMSVPPAATGMPPAAGAPTTGVPATSPALAPAAPAGVPEMSPAMGMSPATMATVAPAAGATTTTAPAAPPAAALPPQAESTGNYLVDKFNHGGPIMWPILIVSIVAVAVVLERIFWWLMRWTKRDPKRIEKVFTAIENGDVAEASRLSRGSRDPVLRMMWNGLNHQHASLQGALQVAAGIEIKRAGRFLVVMDTLVTLAPLLGLLGTITGLMRSFSFLGNEELAVQQVTGGIAEALIATACGLGIAIFALVPFNFFTSRVSNLEFELQTAATNLEVMLESQKPRELDITAMTK